MKIYFPRMISIFIIGSLFLVSCGGDSGNEEPIVNDTTNPSISIEQPTDNQHLIMGGSFYFKGTFTDDIELDKVVFSLQDQKPGKAYGATGLDDEPWKISDETINLSGTSQTIDSDIFDTEANGIPYNIYTGIYTLSVTCYDKAGNFSTETLNIDID